MRVLFPAVDMLEFVGMLESSRSEAEFLSAEFVCEWACCGGECDGECCWDWEGVCEVEEEAEDGSDGVDEDVCGNCCWSACS